MCVQREIGRSLRKVLNEKEMEKEIEPHMLCKCAYHLNVHLYRHAPAHM